VVKLIYTIGSSTREIEDFIALLRKFKIQALVDVRRFPQSRLDHFTQKNLSLTLENCGIRYFYLGDTLGGFRKRGYEDYTHTQDFACGIEKLKKDRYPICHRFYVCRKISLEMSSKIHCPAPGREWMEGHPYLR
jgi:uncharacterized protein (DUF488 family)